MKGATLTMRAEQDSCQNDNRNLWCNVISGKKRVAEAVKLVPSTFSSDSIPPLFLGSHSSNCTLSGIYSSFHQSWFLPFMSSR